MDNLDPSHPLRMTWLRFVRRSKQVKQEELKMTTFDEKRLRAYYATWSTGDPDKVIEFFANGAVFEDLASDAKFEGRDAIRPFAVLTYNGGPDFCVVPQQIVVNGSHAAASWIMSGTHSGDLPGLPATGKTFEVRASSIIQTRASQILHITDYWNPVSFQKAVGLV